MIRIFTLTFLLALGMRAESFSQNPPPGAAGPSGVAITLPITPTMLLIAVCLLVAANILFFVWLMRLGRRRSEPVVIAPAPERPISAQPPAPGRLMEISMVVEDPLAETREALAEMLQKLSVSVHSFMEKNQSYTERLIDHQTSLQEAMHQEQMEQIKACLLEELKRMQASNRNYRSDLEQNSERLIREQERVREMHADATLDPVTRVMNRPALLKALKIQFDRARDLALPFSMLLIGIDRHDAFVSQYGEESARKMLQVVARLMKEQVRSADQVGRLGDDLFAVVMPETHAEQGRLVARDLLAAVNRSFLKHGEEKIGVTVSIGIGQIDPAGEVPKAFIERVYEAVVKVRQDGGNGVAIA